MSSVFGGSCSPVLLSAQAEVSVHKAVRPQSAWQAHARQRSENCLSRNRQMKMLKGCCKDLELSTDIVTISCHENVTSEF